MQTTPAGSWIIGITKPDQEKTQSGEASKDSFWEGLKIGLFHANLPSTVIMLCIPLTFAVLLVTLVQPGILRGNWHSQIAMGKYDDYVFLTNSLLMLSEQNNLDDTVLLLGTSSARIAIPNDAYLTEQVASRTVNSAQAFNLSSASQTLWESLEIADILPDRMNGVVFIGLSPRRLATPPERLEELIVSPRLGYISERMDEEARELGFCPPRRTGVYFWDNRRFFLPRIEFVIRNLARSYRWQWGEALLDRAKIAPAVWDEQVQTGLDDWPLYDQHWEANHEVIREIVACFQSKGDVTIVLMESPLNPNYRDEAYPPDRYSEYQARLESLAAELGIVYWDINEAAGLTADVFFDRCHLDNLPAQQRVAQTMADVAAQYMNAQENGTLDE